MPPPLPPPPSSAPPVPPPPSAKLPSKSAASSDKPQKDAIAGSRVYTKKAGVSRSAASAFGEDSDSEDENDKQARVAKQDERSKRRKEDARQRVKAATDGGMGVFQTFPSPSTYTPQHLNVELTPAQVKQVAMARAQMNMNAPIAFAPPPAVPPPPQPPSNYTRPVPPLPPQQHQQQQQQQQQLQQQQQHHHHQQHHRQVANTVPTPTPTPTPTAVDPFVDALARAKAHAQSVAKKLVSSGGGGGGGASASHENDPQPQIPQITYDEIDRKLNPKVQYAYDSDEDNEGGTWEHRRRLAEMKKTQEKAELLTKMNARKHHIADFLPKEEYDKFMEKARAVKSGVEYTYEDYQKEKIAEDNIGFQMLQKAGWSKGSGLGPTEQGRLAPVNKGAQSLNQTGVGQTQPAEIEKEDDIFDLYRKRNMLAYKFRPNPLNNPRRPY